MITFMEGLEIVVSRSMQLVRVVKNYERWSMWSKTMSDDRCCPKLWAMIDVVQNYERRSMLSKTMIDVVEKWLMIDVVQNYDRWSMLTKIMTDDRCGPKLWPMIDVQNYDRWSMWSKIMTDDRCGPKLWHRCTCKSVAWSKAIIFPFHASKVAWRERFCSIKNLLIRKYTVNEI